MASRQRGGTRGKVVGAGVVGAMAIGLYLGTQMDGLGTGGDGKTLSVSTAGGEEVAEADRPEGATVVEEVPAKPAGTAGPPEMVVVRISDGTYLIRGGTADEFQTVDLDEAVRRVSEATGSPEGLKVRIERTATARAGDQDALMTGLTEAGIDAAEIQTTTGFVDGQ